MNECMYPIDFLSYNYMNNITIRYKCLERSNDFFIIFRSLPDNCRL